MTNPTEQEREAVISAIAHSLAMSYGSHVNAPKGGRDWRAAEDLLSVLEEVLSFRRPTPHVVTTVEELRALGPFTPLLHGTDRVVMAGHLRAGIDSAKSDNERALIETFHLPATVLAPAPAPADREALHVKIAAAMHALGPCDDADCLDPDDWGYCDKRTALALDAIEGVRRG